jgi:hypothetical protein
MLALEIAAGIVLGGLTLVYWRTILFAFWFVVGLALTFGASAFVVGFSTAVISVRVISYGACSGLPAAMPVPATF